MRTQEENKNEINKKKEYLRYLKFGPNFATLAAGEVATANLDRWFNGVWFGMGSYYRPSDDGTSNGANLQLGTGKEKGTGKWFTNGMAFARDTRLFF